MYVNSTLINDNLFIIYVNSTLINDNLFIIYVNSTLINDNLFIIRVHTKVMASFPSVLLAVTQLVRCSLMK